MKPVKKWLLPVLTCLVVTGAAALPAWISQIRDERQFGQVQTLTAHPEASASPALEERTLPDRMALYAKQRFSSKPILSFRDSVNADDPEGQEQAQAAQELLIEAGILPEWLFEPFDGAEFSRLLLWDPAEGSAARDPSAFWDVEWTYYAAKEWRKSVHVTLDTETGLPIELFVNDTELDQWLSPKAWDFNQVVDRFFELLGVETESEGFGYDSGQVQSYAVTGTALFYEISWDDTSFSIMLNIAP